MNLPIFTLDEGERIAVNPRYVAYVAEARSGIADGGELVGALTLLFIHAPAEVVEMADEDGVVEGAAPGILGLREPFDQVVSALRATRRGGGGGGGGFSTSTRSC